MVYKVIGLMSGSSLDGLDIAFVQLEEVRGKWSFEILAADCIPYADDIRRALQQAAISDANTMLRLHTSYGRYIAMCVNNFISVHHLDHQVHFIASHGHTVMHEPENNTTFQIGCGATIAALTGIHVISDLRAMDVALGGQGAPIVPIGDMLLFGDYDYLLNIGGIANITVSRGSDMIAYDLCPANQVLNLLAEKEGKLMDEDGNMAAAGMLLPDVLDELNGLPYYKIPPPKSLSNESVKEMIFPSMLQSPHTTCDLLHTVSVHIAQEVAHAIVKHPHHKQEAKILITGGGAFNTFLTGEIVKYSGPLNVTVALPDTNVIKYKEALIMALIGTLRWRGEVNVLRAVTGAVKDSIGGALWLV